jgi:hypothetical protein
MASSPKRVTFCLSEKVVEWLEKILGLQRPCVIVLGVLLSINHAKPSSKFTAIIKTLAPR